MTERLFCRNSINNSPRLLKKIWNIKLLEYVKSFAYISARYFRALTQFKFNLKTKYMEEICHN